MPDSYPPFIPRSRPAGAGAPREDGGRPACLNSEAVVTSPASARHLFVVAVRPPRLPSRDRRTKRPIMSSRAVTQVRIGRTSVEFTNLDKVLYPRTGFTKGDVVRYYLDVASAILPHLRSRALTMKRYPDGVDGDFFYEKNCPSHRPDWIHTAMVASTRGRGATQHCVVDNAASLAWVANLADLELHVSLAKTGALHRPTAMVFDLDPGEGADILDCAQVAVWLQEQLRFLSLESFPKTSGNKGLQIYVPLNTPTDFGRTAAASRTIAQILESAHPDCIVTNMRKELRRGKVLIDWSQNQNHKTTICVYSLRATPDPAVSTPLGWKEVSSALRRRDAAGLRFGPSEVLARIERHGDLFADVLTLKQKL